MDIDQPPRSQSKGMRRGIVGRCPNCAAGKLFSGYLTINKRCSECGEPLGDYKTADAPAVLTISLVGVLLVPVLWVGFAVYRPDPIVLIAYIGVLMVILSLLLLRLVKGAFVGYLWALDEKDRGA